MNKKKLLINLLKYGLTAVILYFLGRQVLRHWSEIENYNWDINYAYAGLSVILGLVALFLNSWYWKRIILCFGYNVTPAEAFKISYLSNLGRYIPGKIWQFFGILYLTGKKGITPEAAGASFVIFQMFTIPAALLVFAVASQLQPAILIDQLAILGEYSSYLLTVSMILVCLILVFFPDPVFRAVNVLLRKLSRPEINFRPDKFVALQIFVGYVGSWVVYGIAFWLFLLAVTQHSNPGVVAAIGIFCIAYQIGYLAVFAPGGFGPREAVLGLLLTPFLGPVGLMVAILARLWSIVIESIAAVIALKVKL